MTATDAREFAVTRTREEIAELLCFGHIVPIRNGYTRSYVEEHHPGWTWNDLMKVWWTAGILESGSTMPHCKEEVVAVLFNSADAFLVEWANGSSPGTAAGSKP